MATAAELEAEIAAIKAAKAQSPHVAAYSMGGRSFQFRGPAELDAELRRLEQRLAILKQGRRRRVRFEP